MSKDRLYLLLMVRFGRLRIYKNVASMEHIIWSYNLRQIAKNQYTELSDEK